MTDWTAFLHHGAGMPAMQNPAVITPEQGGFKVSKPPAKVKAPPALKQPAPAVPFKPAKQPKAQAPAGGKKAVKHNDPWGEFGPEINEGTRVKYPPELEETSSVNPDERMMKREPGAESERGRHRANLSPQDRRFVELESARFVAANRDTWDDSHELAVRAHNHAAAVTSTFTRQRSAAVCEAFVATVTKLGAAQYRPAPRRTASAPNTNFPDSLLYLG